MNNQIKCYWNQSQEKWSTLSHHQSPSLIMTAKLDQVYADLMKAHPFGIAMYRPLPSSVFSPGSCGYFDNNGSWNLIAHLDNTESLLRKGLEPPAEDLEKAPVDNGITWGPMISSNVKSTKIDLSGGV